LFSIPELVACKCSRKAWEMKIYTLL
jgi:hypothetical protein